MAAENPFKKTFSQLPPQAQAIILIVLMVAGIMVVWLSISWIKGTIKRIKDKAKDASLQAQGITPTYLPEQYKSAADQIWLNLNHNNAFVAQLLIQGENEADWHELYKAFGTKSYWFIDYDLLMALNKWLDNPNAMTVNDHFRAKGIGIQLIPIP